MVLSSGGVGQYAIDVGERQLRPLRVAAEYADRPRPGPEQGDARANDARRQIEAEIAATRARLAGTVDELAVPAPAQGDRPPFGRRRQGQAATRRPTRPTARCASSGSPPSVAAVVALVGLVALGAARGDVTAAAVRAERLPIRMLHDRVLVSQEASRGSDTPAAASSSRRPSASASGCRGREVVAIGQQRAPGRTSATACCSTARTGPRSSCTASDVRADARARHPRGGGAPGGGRTDGAVPLRSLRTPDTTLGRPGRVPWDMAAGFTSIRRDPLSFLERVSARYGDLVAFPVPRVAGAAGQRPRRGPRVLQGNARAGPRTPCSTPRWRR